jgi:hypothetical protein
LGVLIEEQRTNLLLRSEDFTDTGSGGSWVLGSNVLAANNVVAPDGELTADRITSANASNQGMYQAVTVTASATYAFSFG